MKRWVSKFVFTDIFLLNTNNDIAHALFNDIATVHSTFITGALFSIL